MISPVSQAQTHEWFSLSEEVNGAVHRLLVYQGKLIVAGDFTLTGSTPNKNIAAWDGSNWSSLGTGFPATLNSSISDMVVHHDSLFVVGVEMTTGGIVVSNKVTVWDGLSWTVLAEANDIINTIEVYNDTVYVAGKFDTIDGSEAKGIAKMNGSNWINLGDGLRYNTVYSDVADLYIYDNKLFATGFIDSAGTVQCKSIAYWDGQEWFNIPSLLSYVYFDDMIEWNGELLFGSLFVMAGWDLSVDIYSWNGTTFSTFSNQYMSNVLDFEIYGGDLYTGGGDVSGEYGSTVRKWDGTDWVTVGTGLNDEVHTLCSFDGELYAGGIFSTTFAGGSNHNYLARYAELNSLNELSDNSTFLVYPNPATSSTSIHFNLNETAELEIDLIDVQGRIVKSFGSQKVDAGAQNIILNLTDIENGVYFVRVGINGDFKFSQFVKTEI
jgi:hypothetical protein